MYLYPQTVHIHNLLKNEYYDVDYDILVIATGASPVIPNIPNIDLKNIFINAADQNIELIGGKYNEEVAIGI